MQPMEPKVLVTVDNFERAETDRYFSALIARGPGIGRFEHMRQLRSVDLPGVRPNRDTLYSEAIFDLDAGPVEVTLPDAGQRFRSTMVTDEDHYVFTVEYGAGTTRLTRGEVGTRYVLAAVRTLVDPRDPADLGVVHALQDAITVHQPGGPGSFEVPAWDQKASRRCAAPCWH
jgi:hypothetical protein